MTVFHLPDLGEGLPDAEIVKWLVKEGDAVELDQPIAEMSTAKAVVELPSPYNGTIVKLHGGEGDVIDTGAALITFAVDGEKTPVMEEKTAREPESAPEPAAEETSQTPAGDTQIFKLPDLGEGLPDAEIVKWLVREGDQVAADDPMVEMSTAKAVVEVPSPFSGTVLKLYGAAGDVIDTGAPLIEFSASGAAAAKPKTKTEPIKEKSGDSGTVVGAVQVGNEIVSESQVGADGVRAGAAVRALAKRLKIDLSRISGSGADKEVTLKDVRAFADQGNAPAAPVRKPAGTAIIGPAARTLAEALGIDPAAIAGNGPKGCVTKEDILSAARDQLANGAASPAVPSVLISDAKDIKAAPKVRAAAREKGVDLRTVKPSGHAGNVTLEDIERAFAAGPARTATASSIPSAPYRRPERSRDVSGQPEKVRGSRRIMAQAMTKSNTEVTNTSIFDEVNIGHWPKGTDITARIIRAIVAACYKEPALNAWFDGEKGEITYHRTVNLGVAVDSPKGLYVPVIHDADRKSMADGRAELNRLRTAIADQSIKPAEMAGATVTLSNFGMIAGRYATPIVSPPEVAIVGIGGLFHKLVMTERGIENSRHMPVSVTFDHRACTGGEAARFLGAILEDLALES